MRAKNIRFGAAAAVAAGLIAIAAPGAHACTHPGFGPGPVQIPGHVGFGPGPVQIPGHVGFGPGPVQIP